MKKIWAFFTGYGVVGQTIGFILFIIIFAIYGIPFLVFLVAYGILWGIHAMFFGASAVSEAAFRWGAIPFYGSISIGIVAAVVWTFLLGRALLN